MVHLQLPSNLPTPTITTENGQFQQESISSVTTFLSSKGVQQEKINNIITEIQLLDEVQSKEFEFIISNGTGTMKKLQYSCKKSNNSYSGNWNAAIATIQVPKLHSHVQTTSKGSRRYGVAGPRKKHTQDSYPARGLTPNEIAKISTHLRASLN